MADNIVGSLFGVSPEQLMQQRQLRDVEQQIAAGRSAALPGSMMSPSLAPFYQQAAQQGQLIGRGVGALLGSEDPELQKITQIKQLSSQFDLTSPTGMREFARALQQIAPNESMMAAKRADEMMGTQEQTALRAAQTRQAEAGKVIQVDLGDRIQLVNALTNEVVREIPKGLTPAQAAKARAEAGVGGTGVNGTNLNNNGVKIGTFDKVGRYKSPEGRVYTAKAVDEAQAEHDQAQDLITKLKNISEDDIKDAYGSAADYTTLPGGRLVASEKTLSAQTKINEVGIGNVLKNLSGLKGATSDKEMAQMIKDFPGYQASPDTMKKWVDRATETTNRFLKRTEKRFGFDTEYGTEKRFTGDKKQSTDSNKTSDDDLINKYLNPKK